MRKISTNILVCLPFLVCFYNPNKSLRSPQERKVAQYVNCDYGYVVRIPPGLVGQVPEYQNHGFYIRLPDGNSTINVSNEFNMSESALPAAVFHYELKFAAEVRIGWKILSRRYKKVKGLDAMTATATYKDKGAQWKSRILIVYRPLDEEGLGNIVYLFELSTPLARYKETSLAFDRVVGGFELTKLPRGPCSND